MPRRIAALVALVLVAGPALGAQKQIAPGVYAEYDRIRGATAVFTKPQGVKIKILIGDLKMRASFVSLGDTISSPDSVSFSFMCLFCALQNRHLEGRDAFFLSDGFRTRTPIVFEGERLTTGQLVTDSGELGHFSLAREDAVRILSGSVVEGRLCGAEISFGARTAATFKNFAAYLDSLAGPDSLQSSSSMSSPDSLSSPSSTP